MSTGICLLSEPVQHNSNTEQDTVIIFEIFMSALKYISHEKLVQSKWTACVLVNRYLYMYKEQMSDSTYKWFWSLFMAVKIFTLYDSVISLGNMSRYCSLFFKVYNAPHIVIQRRTDEWFHNSCLQCLDLLSDITTLFTRNLFWLAPSPSLLMWWLYTIDYAIFYHVRITTGFAI